MNRLLRAAAALLCAVGLSAFGQGVRYDGRVVLTQSNVPYGANAQLLGRNQATVTIFPAAGCAVAKTTIYSNSTLTAPQGNPITTPPDGGFGFWAAAGNYFYQVQQNPQSPSIGCYPITLGGTGGGGGGFNNASEIPGGVINGSNPTFTLSNVPVLLFLDLNGIQMTAGVDYSLSGSTITMTTIPQGGGTPDKLYATYFYGSSTSMTPFAQVPGGLINGSNTAFTLTHTPIALFLTRNGVRLQPGGVDFSITGTSITMTAAPQSGDVFNAQYFY